MILTMNTKILSILLLSFFIKCTGWNLLSAGSPRIETHPIRGGSNPAQSISRGGFLFFETSTWTGDLSKSEPADFGESCAYSIFSVYAYGDASVEASMRNGNIRDVGFVEFDQIAVLGGTVYQSFCTVVWGRRRAESIRPARSDGEKK
ncbi:TRL-like family protein [Leptospira inadai serovar Lyme str. 10]|uniref:TRL-like family protein n=2 Tax=Leptospira inadai TaxID=29506 RepID=V6HY69_9LEPT|nr:TRL-like family protein [Leptospira inadai serovar Lyme str. 10]